MPRPKLCKEKSVDAQINIVNLIMNNKVNSDIETIFFMTAPEYSAINSCIVRDIINNGGDISQFLPNEISNLI